MDSQSRKLKDILSILLIVLTVFKVYEKYRNIKSKQRRMVKDVNLQKDMSKFFASTYSRIKESDPEQFKNATRMSKETFDMLLNLLKNKLNQSANRTPISSECRLFLTLIYLAHGGSQQVYSLSFKIDLKTIKRITLETCKIIWNELSSIYLSSLCGEEWKKIAENFELIWKIPNCTGAIGGKRINVTPYTPKSINLTHLNKKKSNSIALLAACDANYNFTAIDIGNYERHNDREILVFSEFGKLLMQEKLDLPKFSFLGNSGTLFPYYFVGDIAFPLKSNIMKPFPGVYLDEKREYYNAHILHVHQIIENTFGILTAKWKILEGTLNMNNKSAESITRATVVLHNFLKITEPNYCPSEYVDNYKGDVITKGLWRQEVKPLEKLKAFSSNNASRYAFDLRGQLCEYLYVNRLENENN